MKYAIVLYDGMADLPVEALGGKTPMELARKPVFDRMAKRGEVGLVRTVADGFEPGSDIANLSVLGYDPALYYTGRSPLEAVSLGIAMGEDDLALRCNLVTLSDEPDFREKTMLDYSADGISSKEAAQLIAAVQTALGDERHRFYSGVSYRHCLIVRGGNPDLGYLAHPHDISGQVIGQHLSQNEHAQPLLAMMEKSVAVLQEHPVNLARIAQGKRPANAIWLWGEGKKPSLPAFASLHGKKGSIVSAVDLLKGIGICAGMRTPAVPGATGYIDTNFKGKAEAAVREWQAGQDFVYIHVEAPDECGHRREAQNKVRAIELIDEQLLPVLLAYLEQQEDYKLMILSDHPTPLALGKHTADPVPYMLYHKTAEKDSGISSIHEESAASTRHFIPNGHQLITRFFGED